MIKVIAFDCDGVLFDSTEANKKYYNHILQHFGLPAMNAEQLAYVHMHTADEALKHLLQDEDLINQVQAYRRHMSYMPFIGHMVLEPTLRGLISKLRPQYKTALATNRTDTINRVLAEHNLRDAFDLVVCALDVPRPKPHPDLLLKVIEHFQISPDQALYVGDSPLDQQAAQAAGMPLVAYRNPQLRALHHIERLDQIAALLNVA